MDQKTCLLFLPKEKKIYYEELPFYGDELIEETFALIEKQMPEVDTTEAKK